MYILKSMQTKTPRMIKQNIMNKKPATYKHGSNWQCQHKLYLWSSSTTYEKSAHTTLDGEHSEPS